MCFEILGFDIMVKNDLSPMLIEVNHAPSFATETDFDHELKHTLITDTLKVLGLSHKRK